MTPKKILSGVEILNSNDQKIQNEHKVNLFWVTISYGYSQTQPLANAPWVALPPEWIDETLYKNTKNYKITPIYDGGDIIDIVYFAHTGASMRFKYLFDGLV